MAIHSLLDVLGLVLDFAPVRDQIGKAQRARFERRFQEVRFAVGERGDALLVAFCEDCRRLIVRRPDDSHIFFRWGQALCRRAALASGEKQLSLYDEAESKFSQAQRVKPDDGEICLARVDALRQRALLSADQEVGGRLLEVCQVCERRTGIHSSGLNDARILQCWGLSLWDLAVRRTGEDAYRFYMQAEEKLRCAYAASPEPEFLVDLSRVRLWSATLHPPEQRREILEQICTMLRDLTRKRKPSAAALATWGKALGNLAWSSTGPDSERLYLQAEEKLSQALRITPEDHEIAAELLRVRGARALLLTGEARRKLLAEVSEASSRLLP